MAPPFRRVFFDCDSTLSRVEGIELLAGPHREEVERLTLLAMEGRLPLEEVYARRLALVAPSRAALEAAGEAYVRELVEDAREVVAVLAALGKEIHVLSGGLLPAVAVLAAELSIPPRRTHAVDVRFAPDGSYVDFDRASPLARGGGKAEVLRRLCADGAPSALVGDGFTDLEAAPAVDLFVGFGGVVERRQVAGRSPVYLRSRGLAPLLGVLLTAAEQERARALPGGGALLERAAAALGRGEVVRRGP